MINTIDENKPKTKNNMNYFIDPNSSITFSTQLNNTFNILKDNPNYVLFSGLELNKDEWNSRFNGIFFLALFTVWLKYQENKEILLFNLDSEFIESNNVIANSDNKIIVFYSNREELPTRKDLVLTKSSDNQIYYFFKWCIREIIDNGSYNKFYNHHIKICNEIINQKEPKHISELSLLSNIEKRNEIEKFKEKILTFYKNQDEIIIQHQQIEEAQNTQEEPIFNVNEQKPIKFIWDSSHYKINFPVSIQDELEKNFDFISSIDNENGFLAQQTTEIKHSMLAIWLGYIYNTSLYTPNNKITETNWEDFRNYVVSTLRITDIPENEKQTSKFIKNKINELEGISLSNEVFDFIFIKKEIDFFKTILYIESMYVQYKNKESIINFEELSQQHYYSVNNSITRQELFKLITHDSLIKNKLKKTTSLQFSQLKEKFPNFIEVIDYYNGAMNIFEKTGIPPTPVLMLGEPGLGKTHFSNELAKIIGSQMCFISMSSLSASWVLSGSAGQWQNAGMGKIAKILINGTSISPIIVLDEIDKKIEGNYDPIGPLYPLLEKHTAKEFIDEYIDFPLDASKIIWVATANKLNSISDPILDRFVVFEIRNLTLDENKKIAINIFKTLTQNIATKPLSDEIINELKTKTPRNIKKTLEKALAYAAAEQEDIITISKKHINKDKEILKTRIGF